jgi:hypothetical protein
VCLLSGKLEPVSARMGQDKNELLEELRRNKANWTPSDAVELLRLFGFQERRTGRGHTLWKRGRVTLTVPEPHGREKVLLRRYASEIVRKIDEAEASASERDAYYEATDGEDA